MAPWFVFAVVAFTLFGGTVWAVAFGRSREARPLSETEAWWRLMAPPLAGAPFLAFMVGWVLQESNPADELVPSVLAVPAALVGAVVLRAALRSLRSAVQARRVRAPIATVGLIRARAVVSERFAAQASSEVLAAALAHEAAHVRGRDPLRIWWAQFVADLQWPMPSAQLRLRQWALALEMRRDDEAVHAGASPTALAEGLILAARLTKDRCGSHAALAAATGRGDGLALRVRRLLADETERPTRRRSDGLWLWAGALVACTALGTVYGDAFLLMIPGVGR